MKNAMKKLTSLLLVALLLVGMIPFAASAEELSAPVVNVNVNGQFVKNVEGTLGTKATYADCLLVGGVDTNTEKVTSVTYNYNGNNDVVLNEGGSILLDANAICYVWIWTEPKEVEAPAEPTVYAMSIDVNGEQKVLTSGTSTSYAECLAAAGIDTTKVNVTNASYQYTTDEGVKSFTFKAGDVITFVADTRVYFFTEEKQAATEPKPTEPKPTEPSDFVVDEEFQHDIWLYIYTNNDLIQPSKRVLLNGKSIVESSQDGGILTKAEILSVVDDYYKATDANKGILWQGAYSEEALDIVKFIAKNDEAPFTNLAVKRTNGTVVIKVRVTGVTTVGTTYTADSSNPKTGDSIYTAMTVMGISAAALASVMYFYNKKRMAL